MSLMSPSSQVITVFGMIEFLDTVTISIMYILSLQLCLSYVVRVLMNYAIFMTLDPSATPARLEATSFPSGVLRL